MIKKCHICNKTIKNYRTAWKCRKCAKLTCPGCRIEGYCIECHPMNTDKAVCYEYFKDKYTESVPI